MANRGTDPAPPGTGVYFGSVPDYGLKIGDEGAKLSGVREGGPAHKAGLKEGDLIIKFGDLPIGPSTITWKA